LSAFVEGIFYVISKREFKRQIDKLKDGIAQLEILCKVNKTQRIARDLTFFQKTLVGQQGRYLV